MAQRSPPRPSRALIVEDDYLIALDLEASMCALGFSECDLAPSSREARSLAMKDQPDVVLVDVCLEGGREGIEVARWLREVCQSPIVFFTENTDQETVERIRKQVPYAPVVPKPVQPDRLAAQPFQTRAFDVLTPYVFAARKLALLIVTSPPSLHRIAQGQQYGLDDHS